jgi:hypothetical protein
MSDRLYHGTTEHLAKMAPYKGILPYAHTGACDRPFSDLEAGTLCLTTLHAPLQAFAACGPDERWGIVEIRTDRVEKKLKPDSHCKVKGRNKSWKTTADLMGTCTIGEVHARAVAKVWIFNPRMNWLVTRSVLHIDLSPGYHKQNLKRITQLHRWLTGEFVTLDEWLGEDKKNFSKEQLDVMKSQLMDRTGLDLFYHGA